MEDYVIWYTPSNQSQLSSLAPFLSIGLSVYNNPDANWPNGYYRLEQALDSTQFGVVDSLANSHIAINCVRGPYPPYSPTGR